MRQSKLSVPNKLIIRSKGTKLFFPEHEFAVRILLFITTLTCAYYIWECEADVICILANYKQNFNDIV